MIGHSAGSAPSLATFVASGDGGGQQGGLLLLVFVGTFAVALAVMNVVNRFRQPYVVVLNNPFKYLVKAVVFGVTSSAVIAVAAILVIATAGSQS